MELPATTERIGWSRPATWIAVLLGASVVALSLGAQLLGPVRDAASASQQLLSWWQATILGVVEGVTEYLPISSTGHLLVVARLLGLPDRQGSAELDALNTYVVAIQFGAILAVAGVFHRRVADMVRGIVGRSDDGRHLVVALLIAFAPAAMIGVALDNRIESVLFGPWPVVIAWMVGGSLILALEAGGRLAPPGNPATVVGDPLLSITHRQALLVGLAQCVALWPGTSRSLVTILAALLVGMSMSAAVEFSFLLGFLTLSAATAFKLATGGSGLVAQFGLATPLVGVGAALFSAVVAIRWLLGYLRRHDLTIFGWYRLAAGGAAIVLLATAVI